MSTPIIESIAVELTSLIDEITESNGFNQDLTAVRPKRLHLEGDINIDGSVIIEQEDAEVEADSEDETMIRQGFAIQALVIDSDTATTALDTRLNQVAADIIKKLYTGQNWTLGGKADGILLRGLERFISDPQIAGVSVNVDVLYRIRSNDPYSQP